jgi:hypothetical protein
VNFDRKLRSKLAPLPTEVYRRPHRAGPRHDIGVVVGSRRLRGEEDPMKNEKGVSEILSAGALIVGLALSPQASVATQGNDARVTGTELRFDGEGRLMNAEAHLGLNSPVALAATDPNKNDNGGGGPTPNSGPKVNIIC